MKLIFALLVFTILSCSSARKADNKMIRDANKLHDSVKKKMAEYERTILMSKTNQR